MMSISLRIYWVAYTTVKNCDFRFCGTSVVSNITMKFSERGNSPEVVEIQSARGRPWRPGVRNSLPWLAAAALVSVVLLTIASVIVLAVSNGQPVSDWKIQLSVLIAIFSGAVNSALVYALYEGITIAWWLETL
jgi:hypothetical protein